MKHSPLRSLLALALLGAAAVALVACSDDGAGNTDAAACTCPAAEAPLAGRIVQRTRIVQISASDGVTMGGGANDSPCLAGETFVSGSCLLNEGPTGEMMLVTAGHVENAMRCGWSSWSIQTHTGTVAAVCLLPPP